MTKQESAKTRKHIKDLEKISKKALCRTGESGLARKQKSEKKPGGARKQKGNRLVSSSKKVDGKAGKQVKVKTMCRV